MQRTVLQTEKAIIEKLKLGKISSDVIYDFINKFPNTSVSEIVEKLGWSTGKVHQAVQRLEKKGLIKSRIVIKNGRTFKEIYSTPWKELLVD